VDTDTFTVAGTDPTALPVDVNTMEPTEHPFPPPMSFTVTLTDPEDVVLGPEITGPGINAGIEGKVESAGDGTTVGGGGGGDVVDTRSYCLMIFQDVYV